MTADSIPPDDPLSLFDFRNVTVLRNGNNALDSITLSIPLGQHVAVLGPNGSGKSSLIKTIARECHPLETSDDSRLTVLGKRRWNIFALRPQLGIVSPDWTKVCDRDISAREAILTGFFGSAELWPESPGDPGYGAQDGASARTVGNSPSRRAPRIRDVFRGGPPGSPCPRISP